MIPPTPASLMEEARAVVARGWNKKTGAGYDVAKDLAIALTQNIVEEVATALHSIQAQTIREMVKVAREVPTFDISEGVTRDRFIDALKSYAKDKGIEIE